MTRSREELQVLCDERADENRQLREQLAALEAERDQARHGLDVLTKALRRSGCCDNGGSPHA